MPGSKSKKSKPAPRRKKSQAKQTATLPAKEILVSPIKTLPRIHDFFYLLHLLPLALFGLYFSHYGYQHAGQFFLAAMALVYLIHQNLGPFEGVLSPAKRNFPWLLTFIPLALAVIALLSFQNFSYVFGPVSIPLDRVYWLWILALILAAFLFRYFPINTLKSDWPPLFSWTLLGAIIITAFCFRMHHAETPGGYYWDDWSVEVIDPLNIATFHEFHFVFPIGKREPFFSYFMAGIFYLLPDASMLYVQRLTCTLIDGITLVLLYFIGKELRSRRAG